MNTRLFSIIRKEFIQILRDKRTLIIILIIPIVQLFLLGYSATSDVRNVPLAVFDQCRCSEVAVPAGGLSGGQLFQAGLPGRLGR